ncbi:hypothetical protein J3Q64DRAFT_1810002 [Phycomyces blakesleeanus]|uniref:Uncharacterized protein n=1 Tax=Phycomyces blakesleeanus TaxID=4837 RepID=A0ABR3AYS1_PHYBL
MVYHQPDTCKCRTPYAQSRLFFRCLHFLSEEVHKKVYITENIPSKVASKGYIYRKLQDVQFVHALGRKKLRSLQEQTLRLILEKLNALFSRQISIVQTLINTVKARIKDRTFFPVNAQNKAIQVDMQAFWNLVKTSGVAGYPADYIDDIDKDCQVWAIDPGVCDIITTVDTSGRQRTTSVNEYYHLLYKKEHLDDYLKTFDLSSFKTTNEADFLKVYKDRLGFYFTIPKYYSQGNWSSSKSKFECYCGSRKDWMRFASHENKYFPPAPADHTEAPLKTIIDFGDGMFNHVPRGNKTASVRLNMMYMLDEYLTSQVCNESKKINLENLVNSNLKRRVYTILQCQETTCNIVWNRNIMATQNLLGILFSARNNNQRRDYVTVADQVLTGSWKTGSTDLYLEELSASLHGDLDCGQNQVSQ